MGLNRRKFLQQSGLSLLTFGSLLSGSIPNNSWLNKHTETLAQSTPRKLALLIGINEYSQSNKLRGCITDVELQKELLIYRFGFNPQDILTLTDNQATKENIETAFLEHLINQATNDDVVIFHFSGLGRKINISQSYSTDIVSNINSLIPQDGISLNNQNIANDITLDTLFSLGGLLSTNKLTMILDTSYQNPPLSLSKKLSSRSYIQDNIANLDKEQLILSKQLTNQLKNNSEINLNSFSKSGLILSATQEGIATEIISNKLTAGLFTYVLTQYLWESTPPNNICTSMGEISSRIALFTSETEKPTVELDVNQNIFPYYLLPQPELAGQALVTRVNNDNTVDLDLVGLPLCLLSNYGINSCFITQKDALKITKISLIERQGRKAKGIIFDSNVTIQSGDILREFIRVIPRNLGLNISLNEQLSRIEKVDATSSLSSINQVNSMVNIGEHFADCILGKAITNNESFESYALFSSAGILFPNSIGKNPNEAVSSAVKRFIPQLKTLLAAKILHLTLNQGSSLLPINASLQITTSQVKTLINTNTFGNKKKSLFGNKKNLNLDKNLCQKSLITNIPIGSEIDLTINNNSDQEIYIILLGRNSSGNAIAYFSPENNVIMPHESISLPQKSNSLKWIVNGAKGLGELVLVASYFPFNETLMKMFNSITIKPDSEQIISLDNPVEICQALLQDLHTGSQITSNLVTNLSDVYALDINQWASFNFVYQIT